jgi:signal transduction histidine kinase
MKSIKKFFEHAKAFCIAYPAVLCGYFIYSYLFYCILQYFFKAKNITIFHSNVVMNVIDSFDAFPFMWLLSFALVKVIEIRTRLHESEEQRLIIEREVQFHQAQLKTLQEVTRGVQHHINNPLAIISLSLGSVQRIVGNNPEILVQLDTANEAMNRITTALEDFSKIREYTVESAGPIVGDIVTPNPKK